MSDDNLNGGGFAAKFDVRSFLKRAFGKPESCKADKLHSGRHNGCSFELLTLWVVGALAK